MLVLSRERDSALMIGHSIRISVVDIRIDKVRLGIQCPASLPVHRKEVYEAIQKEDLKLPDNIDLASFPDREVLPDSMLVVSRHRDESVVIGDCILITIVDIRGDKVRLGIESPRELCPHREEVYEAIQREQLRENQATQRKEA